MARAILKKIQFVSSGFAAILNGPGVESVVAAEARRQAQALEQRTGEAYAVGRMPNATSRVVYTAKPEGAEEEAKRKIDHETWINEIWPKVGGLKWRPHS